MAPPDGSPGRVVVPVFVFHSVADRPGASVWTLERAAFARIARAIADSGRTGLRFGDLTARLRRHEPLPPRPVVVTFDDGFADNIDAVRVCRDNGLPATVFVTTGYLGRPEMLTAPGLRELGDLPGVEIGSHTVSHRRLDELPVAEIRRELADSRAVLEDALSREVATLAYPHGNYDGRVIRIAGETGYRGAAAVRMASSHDREDPYAVSRLIVDATTPEATVRRFLEGGVPPAPRGERLRTRGFRLARRAIALARPAVPTPPAP